MSSVKLSERIAAFILCPTALQELQDMKQTCFDGKDGLEKRDCLNLITVINRFENQKFEEAANLLRQWAEDNGKRLTLLNKVLDKVLDK